MRRGLVHGAPFLGAASRLIISPLVLAIGGARSLLAQIGPIPPVQTAP